MAPPLSKPDRPQKRGRTDVTADFFQTTKEVFPKYHVIHSEKPEKPARKISPFTVARCLKEAIGTNYKVTKLASGDLLLEIQSKAQVCKLANIVSFEDIPVLISTHRSLNTVRGVISEIDFLDLSEEEMLNGLSEQNVSNVQRIKIRKDNKELPTKHLILTFTCCTLPETIEVGYTKVAVRPYIPNPRRCFNCQRFGHGSQSCRGRKTCAKCASKDHASEICEAAPRCANCEGEHAAYSRSCPSWKREKEIITLKTIENISFKEARNRILVKSKFSLKPNMNFADVVRQGDPPHRPPAPAQTTRSEAGTEPPSPPAVAAHAAPPAAKQAMPSVELASLKASAHEERSEKSADVQSARPSSASDEVMETNQGGSVPSTSQGRRNSLDTAYKENPRITGRKPIKRIPTPHT